MKIDPRSPAFSPDTASESEMRDWLAERKGYRIDLLGAWYIDPQDGGRKYSTHPVPPTLDAAAAAMPEGWVWYRIKYGVSRIQWEAHTTGKSIRIPDTGDEIADRFRLAAKCILAEEAKQ